MLLAKVWRSFFGGTTRPVLRRGVQAVAGILRSFRMSFGLWRSRCYMMTRLRVTAIQLEARLIARHHPLSLSTILRCRQQLGWTFRGSAYCQLIRVANKAKRLQFAQDFLHEAATGFNDVVFTDETSIQLRTSHAPLLQTRISSTSLSTDGCSSRPSLYPYAQKTNPAVRESTCTCTCRLVSSLTNGTKRNGLKRNN